MTSPSMRRLAAAFAMLAALSAPAMADVQVGIGSISPANNQIAPASAQTLENSLRNALARAVEKAQDEGDCDISAVELSDQFIKDRSKEQALQSEGYAPEDGAFDGDVTVTDVVTGVVGDDGDGGFDYVIGITGADGADKGEVMGSGAYSDIPKAADEIAQQLVEQLCAKRAYRIVGGGGDPVDQVVCDINSTFVLEGALFGVELSGGPTGSYTFVRTPPGPVLWIASGTYAIEWPDGPDKPGTMRTFGEGTTIAGQQSDTSEGGETFTLTPEPPC